MLPERARCARGPQLLTMDGMRLRYNVWELQFMYKCIYLLILCVYLFIYIWLIYEF